jgi:hypothetical protein
MLLVLRPGADDRLLGGHRAPPRRHQGELQHVHRLPVVRRRRLHRGLLVPRLRQQHRPGRRLLINLSGTYANRSEFYRHENEPFFL